MQIQRVGFRFFKSIGAQTVELDLTKRINLLIGPNNAGKSNVIAALSRLHEAKSNWRKATPLEFHKRNENNPPKLTMQGVYEGNSKESEVYANQLWRFEEQIHPSTYWDTPFATWDVRQKSHLQVTVLQQRFQSNHVDEKTWLEALSRIADRIVNDWLAGFKRVIQIPAFRRIAEGEFELSGRGIIPLLASWKTPEIGKDGDRAKFTNVQEFLQQLIGIPDAELEIPPKKDELIVQASGLRLPLSSYGTGLHQLIVLTIAVLEHSNSILCLEEPEVHLHPRLQRTFLNFLLEKTDNQYVIATHSPFLLARPNDSHIIRLWTEAGETKNEVVTTTQQSLEILRDLGVSASDIMQSRFVIWVEGPSDAIYLRRWIELAIEESATGKSIQEGVDFSIMFYGGRLLSHLSLNHDKDDSTESGRNVLPLLPINRNAAVMIDSDKSNEASQLNETKKRIVRECDDSGSLSWVTFGREIENYLPPNAIVKAYEGEGGKLANFKLPRFSKIDTAVSRSCKSMDGPEKRLTPYSKAKVSWAKRIAPLVTSLDVLDLREKMAELIQAITKSHV